MMLLSDIHIRDPFILTHEGVYYLFGTPGKYAWEGVGGFYCSRSTDLVNWTEPAQCFAPPADFWATKNYWAPEVHEYNGRFYMFASFYAEGHMRATQILAADRPEGPYEVWSCPITPGHWMCLDGTFYVENGVPYMVFCHEWLQVTDGEIWAIEMTPDLKAPAGQPQFMLRASDPVWAPKNAQRYVTDGPFMHRTANGKLLMIWSTFGKTGYVEAVAVSESGTLRGPWRHCEAFMSDTNGGHGMLFRRLDGQLMFTMHCPNTPYGAERAVLFEVEEVEHAPHLKLKEK